MRAEFAHLLSRVPLLRTWLPRAAQRSAAPWHEQPLEALAWDDFQRLLVEGFVRRGYHATGEPRSLTPGSDLLLRQHRETFLVDCKAWRNRKVDVDAVKTLQRAILARGVNGGILITAGRIGREAGKAAAAARIQTIDGPALRALVAPVRRVMSSSPVVDETLADTVPAREANRTIPTSPKCPLCSKPMRLRTARRGRHAGHGFWSCIEHPHCKGLRALTGQITVG